MDLVRTLPFREGDIVRCTGMDPRYSTQSLLLTNAAYTISRIRYAPPRGDNGPDLTSPQVQWIYVTENRGRWNYEAKYFELVAREQNDNDVFDCIQDFLKTVPKKGKTCHQAITDQNRNSTS